MKFVKNVALLLLVFVLFSCSKEETSSTPEPAQVPKYTVSITAGDGGTVSSAGGTYDKDTQISVTATPNAEYLFQAWGDGSTDNPRSIKVTADLTITANFVKKQYDLTINVVGEGAVTEEIVIQGGRYNSGSQIKLTATAAEGWEFTTWTGAIESTDNAVTVNINEGKEVTATFTRKKYDLNITIEGEGTVTEEVVVQPGQYDYETQVKLTAVPEEGWEFTSWSGDLESTDNPVTLTVEEVQSITAKFVMKDSDGDGVPDLNDNCPDSSSGEVDETGCPIPPIYLDSNGITIKARDWAEVGDTAEINNVIYTIVDKNTLVEMINSGLDVSGVCTSKITDFTNLFRGKSFNQDISTWDTSNVITMRWTFESAQSFNKDISNWDVSNVISMKQMFANADRFNQDLSKWDTSSVTDMQGMFYSADSFNQSIDSWDVSNVVDMNNMFMYTKTFNSDLNSWDVSNVTQMIGMFSAAEAFNGNISEWNTSKVTSMRGMFSEGIFNGDISKWDTSAVVDMSYMFGTAQFNRDISNWDVSNVLNMNDMFRGGIVYQENPFNQDISDWDTSKVMSMERMFYRSGFNQNLSSWNVQKVEDCIDFNSNSTEWTLPKPNFTNCNPN